MIDILVVDDNPDIRSALRKGLDDQGNVHVVGEAADGITALQLANNLRPDVVLIDVNMPRLDGVETTRRLRSLLPQTVLVGMSCHTRDVIQQALLSAGADGFLPKETLLNDLLPLIRSILQRRV
jgi:DNA-binding NarL/FixJ family response regulator